MRYDLKGYDGLYALAMALRKSDLPSIPSGLRSRIYGIFLGAAKDTTISEQEVDALRLLLLDRPTMAEYQETFSQWINSQKAKTIFNDLGD